MMVIVFEICIFFCSALKGELLLLHCFREIKEWLMPLGLPAGYTEQQ